MNIENFNNRGSLLLDNSRHLLMLAYYFPPMNESGALRPSRFEKFMRPYGVQTKIISAGEETHSAIFRYCDEKNTTNVITYNGWINYIARFFHRVLPYNDQLKWVPHALAASIDFLNRSPLIPIFSTSPPSATHIVALFLKKRYGMRWVADLRDPIWGNPFHSSLRACLWNRFIEQLILKYADTIIGNTQISVDALKKKHKRNAHKVKLIWNGFDPDEKLNRHGLEERNFKYITHAGSLYGGRHPGELVASLSRLISLGRIEPTQYKLRLLGYLDLEEPWVVQYNFKDYLNQKWIDCPNRILPRQEALEAMASSDYLLLLDLNDQGTRLQLPAKLFEYIRIGRPILAFTSPESPAENILRQSGIPFTCIYQKMSNQEKDDQILSFLQLSSEFKEPSEWFQNEFNGAVQTKALAALLGFLETPRR